MGHLLRILNSVSVMTMILIKTTPADLHHPAKHGDRVGLLLLPDEVVPQFDSLAKKAAAFFKISRSICRRWFSFLNRFTSASSSLRETSPSTPSCWSFRNSRTQRETLDWPTPRRRATSLALYPCSLTMLTASCLNSFVYFTLFSFSFIGHLSSKVATLSIVSVSIKPPQLPRRHKDTKMSIV